MDQELERFLADAINRPPHDQVMLSIRGLLARWGAKRRGYLVVDQIERDLGKVGLATHPSLMEGWIDDTITLTPVAHRKTNSTESGVSVKPVEAVDRSLPDVALRVGSLPSANRKVVGVALDASLEQAQSLMMCYDYSQLAVVSGLRDLRGAVSWESIAQARIRDPRAELREAIAPAETVRSSDDLLAQIPRIMEAGFVFVLAEDKRINGIVTTADLSQQFADLAKPFLCWRKLNVASAV